MPAPPSTQPQPVTIGLLDGTTRRGRLARFSPTMPDLALERDDGGRPEIVPAERVAFVAHHRAEGERIDPPGPDAERFKVHVAGRRTFAVATRLPAWSSPVGFRAVPTEADGAFEEIFFYHHGVSARERDEPLGSMLVSEGRVPEAALKQAIEKQRADRGVPIGQILIEQRKVDPASVEEATKLQERKRLRLGEVLVEAGLVNANDIELALGEQRRRRGKRLGEVLVELGLIGEGDLARTLAKKFDLPFVDLDACVPSPTAATAIPRELVQKYGVLPLDCDAKSVTIAISDPLALEAIDTVRFHAKRRVDEVVVTASQLKTHVQRFLERPSDRPSNGGELDAILQKMSDGDVAAAGAVEEDEEEGGLVEQNPGDGGIVGLVNQIIIDAFRRGASDVHLEPNGKERPMIVRFRVDGDCVAYQELPATVRNPVVARLKIMARLDISERRKPQDGKIRFKLPDRQLELRVATIPTVNGNEDVVLRLLASSKPLPLEDLRLSPHNLGELRRLLKQPYGLLLCVGPTGSGKTTTLHSALGAINTVDMKIWTAEDPVEITQPGLRQVQVNPRIGFTFAQAMRAFLRADPDVIMVGEMRDGETAGTAVEASLTGHLVLSTLHTNSAPETITRLLDMGLDPFSFGDALLGVVAQRLARGLCPRCRFEDAPTDEEGEQLARALGAEADRMRVWHARGCDACGGSGYKGRVGIHELLVVNDAIKHAIAHKAPVDEIRRLACEGGMRTLLQDGLLKARDGLTDVKQVLAVCSK